MVASLAPDAIKLPDGENSTDNTLALIDKLYDYDIMYFMTQESECSQIWFEIPYHQARIKRT